MAYKDIHEARQLPDDTHTSLLPNGPEVPRHAPIMEDVYGVGPHKPLGYLPIGTIRKSGERPEDVIDLSTRRGLSTVVTSEGEGFVGGGALFVYDEKALGLFLSRHAHVLNRSNWPTGPLEFTKRVSTEVVGVKHDPSLYGVIARAYCDPRPQHQQPSQEAPSRSSGVLHALLRRLGSIAFKKK